MPVSVVDAAPRGRRFALKLGVATVALWAVTSALLSAYFVWRGGWDAAWTSAVSAVVAVACSGIMARGYVQIRREPADPG